MKLKCLVLTLFFEKTVKNGESSFWENIYGKQENCPKKMKSYNVNWLVYINIRINKPN